MKATPLAGARLTSALAGYFTESVSILANTPTADTRGYEKPGWAVATGLSGLAAAVGSDSLSVNQLQGGSTMVRRITAIKVKLASHHPDVTSANRLRWNGTDYRIVSAFPDAAGTFTHLSCELVVPGV